MDSAQILWLLRLVRKLSRRKKSMIEMRGVGTKKAYYDPYDKAKRINQDRSDDDYCLWQIMLWEEKVKKMIPSTRLLLPSVQP